jgi:RNA polymerase sigma-70 factor (ECF subfamily)
MLDEECAAFCRREHERLVRTLRLYCGDLAVAEELAQEALYRACRQWREVREMPAPGAWVHRVAINLANSLYRRRQAERRALARHGGRMPHEADPSVGAAVREAVAALPARQRAALVLRHHAGYSIQEVADQLGVSPGAVKQLTHRASEALREVLLPLPTTPEVPDAR